MYNSKSSVMFLGLKKQSFNDSVMWKVDFYVDGEVDSFFVQDSNTLLPDLQKLKPTSMCTIECSWQKSQQGWKHRLISVHGGI